MEKHELVETLRKHPFVKGLLPQHIEKLADLASEVGFEKDQIIFREGAEPGFFYLITSGEVALEVAALGRTLHVQTLSEGSELDCSSVLASHVMQFQVRALGPARALAFQGPRLREACDQETALGYAMMHRMLGTAIERLQALSLRFLDIYTPPRAKEK